MLAKCVKKFNNYLMIIDTVYWRHVGMLFVLLFISTLVNYWNVNCFGRDGGLDQYGDFWERPYEAIEDIARDFNGSNACWHRIGDYAAG